MHKTLLLAPIIALLIMVPALAHANYFEQIETQYIQIDSGRGSGCN